jgi:hypothetical protein
VCLLVLFLQWHTQHTNILIHLHAHTHMYTHTIPPLYLLHSCMDVCAIAEWSTLSGCVGLPPAPPKYLSLNFAFVWKEYSFWGYMPEITVMNTIMWTRNAIQGGYFF